MAPIQPPSNKSGDITLAVSGIVIALAVISVALRFYTRILTKSGLKSDDWWLFAAVVATLITAALLLWGMGRMSNMILYRILIDSVVGNTIDPKGLWVSENTDPSYVYTTQDVQYLKIAFSTSVLYFTIASATKLGILLMYNRIFNVSVSFRYALRIASGLVMGWWVGCTVATLTNCIPLE